MNIIHSPIFGDCEEPPSLIKPIIEKLARNYPVHVFAAINRRLNERGYCALIDKIPEREHEDDILH